LERADARAIEERIASEDDAWTRGDAVAFSKWVLPDCVFTNIRGAVFVGHDDFETQHDRIFATIYRGTRLRQTIDHLRFIRSDVAVVDTAAAVTGLASLSPGAQSPDRAIHSKLVQVFVKERGEWWVASYHNVEVKGPPPPPAQAPREPG
jgi:uncharacterized protein (TIGR02246 family)